MIFLQSSKNIKMSALVSTVTTEDFKRLKKQRCKWHPTHRWIYLLFINVLLKNMKNMNIKRAIIFAFCL